MEPCPIDLLTSPSERLFVSVCVCDCGCACVWLVSLTHGQTRREGEDCTKKDLEQMFLWPQSHFLSPTLDFFFLFLISLWKLRVLSCCYGSFLLRPSAQTDTAK